MKLTQLAGITALFMIPHTARAQSCPIAAPNNAPAWFAFQVDQEARFIGDTTRIPRPDVRLTERQPVSDSFALVQFMIDTTGTPIVSSGRMLRLPTGLARDSVVAAMPGWRFTPAIAKGCKVPQLVQTPLRWR
jgi:hypothetical protein